MRKTLFVLSLVVCLAGAAQVQRGPKNIAVEERPAVIQRRPGIVVAPRPMKLPPTFATVATPFQLTNAYHFENAAQAVGPGASKQCIGGGIILATGGTEPTVMKLRTLGGQPQSPTATAQLPLPAKTEAATDHMLLKMKDGSLLALRTVITWGPHPFTGEPQPPWWDKVTIQGSPTARAWRSWRFGRRTAATRGITSARSIR